MKDWLELNAHLLPLVLAGVCLLLFYLRCRKRIRSFLLGGSSGLAALLLLHFYGDAVGFTPTLCLANLLISVFLGIPGVALLWLTSLVLQ